MGESLSTWTPSCNGSVRVELDGQRTTSDSGALLREALDNSGVIEALEDNLVDLRNPLRVRHSLASQLRTLVLHAFFLVTNLGKFDWPPEKVLALYRKRGSAEAHMGEVKSALDVHLSSTDRGASTVQDVMARNEVSLLLSLYAYQVLHGLRCLLERQTRQGWSLSRMREQVLKVAATLRLHARRITVHLGAAADKWWPTLLKGLPKLASLS
ncbi:transposase [Halomonas sp. KM007]